MTLSSRLIATTLLVALGAFPGAALASDHIDGPVTTTHPLADLSDLFAFETPGKPGHLTVVLNVHPFAVEKNHFSSKINYRVVLRGVTSCSAGIETNAASEVAIVCTFDDRPEPHTMTCSVGESSRTANINEVDSSEDGSGLRVFSGLRSDVFFFNTPWAKTTGLTGVIADDSLKGSNSTDQFNTLSIVVDVDVSRIMGKGVSMLALAAESVNGKTGARLDRVGRPEVTNVTMLAGGTEDIRDEYNTEAPFAVSNAGRKKFTDRVNASVAYYDALDKTKDWTDAQRESYTDVVIDDTLLIDLSQPSSGEDYFSIEWDLLNGKAPASRGGRLLTDDITDRLFSILINRGREPISDGVDAPSKAPTQAFPYLREPDNSPEAKAKAAYVRNMSGIPEGTHDDHDVPQAVGRDLKPRKGLVSRFGAGIHHGKKRHRHK